MEVNKNIEVQTTKGDSGYTYVFDIKEDLTMGASSRFRKKVWQLLPSVCGSVLCIPFGMMLGWPSPTYPTLLQVDSPVPISIDQSAMIAGFLMIGNSVSTPFSSNRRFSSKSGIILGASLMTIGWVLMWQATNIYWLLASRFLIGTGNGYGVGQLKLYISEMCEEHFAQFLIKQTNLYAFLGLVVTFAVGPFVEFRQFGIIALIVSVFVLFLTVFLPSTPRELIKNKKLDDAKRLISFLYPEGSVGQQIMKIQQELEVAEEDISLFSVVKERTLRKNFVIFVLLVFFQQFTGIAATIVYSQILFATSHCPSPKFCALVYAGVFLFSNIYGALWSLQYNKKHVLLWSSGALSVILVLKVIIVIFKINENLWNFSSLVVMLMYVSVHSMGLGNVPFTLIPSLFPKQAKKVIVYFFIIEHSLLALIITKIFQVMYDRLEFYTPFVLFLSISGAAFVFILIFVPNDRSTDK